MALSFAFTGLLCVLLTPQIETFATSMPDFFRLVLGFGLLGLAALAVAMVLRSLPVPAPSIPPRRAVRRDSEFRRGFAKARAGVSPRLRVEPRIVPNSGEVVVLRRPDQPAPTNAARNNSPLASHANIEIVKQRLHDRAEALWRRRAG
jgi:hypothetical protein